MLRELRVKNLAVIEEATVVLHPGLNVLTGETGAGKSMLVDALSLLLGERAHPELVRSGAERAVVEAEFEGVAGAIGEYCEDAGVELDDGRLVVRREINLSGRNRAWAGGGPATLNVLSDAGERLVDLHGQHETQSLLRAGTQREILDEFADSQRALNEVRAGYARLREAEKRESDLNEKVEEVRRRVDYLRHVAGEIEGAVLEAGEDEKLAVESKRLANVEELTFLVNSLVETLDEGEQTAGSFLGAASRILDTLEKIDETVTPWKETLASAIAEVDEVVRNARDYLSSVESDPERLRHLETRRDLIFKLLQKYGPSVEDVLATGKSSREELELLDTAALDLTQLKAERERLTAELQKKADRLTAVRTEAARKLSFEVSQLIPGLGLPEGKFVVDLVPKDKLSGYGSEDVVFAVELNAGMPARPLAKVASGGELSRIMLAIKVVLAGQDSIPTLIFDEVDQGIGGEVANSVAVALAEVGRARQVLVITHLAQVAAIADHHLLISKDPSGGVARATVNELSEAERVDEIARMLGAPDDPVVREHANELLKRRARAG
jgi:DNA repair protein RecN (Recombination protein N)